MKRVYFKISLSFIGLFIIIISCQNGKSPNALLKGGIKTGTELVDLALPRVGDFQNDNLTEIVLSKINKYRVNPADELISRRDRISKHYLRSDGKTIDAIISPVSVHYMDNKGNWKDIDTKIVNSSSSFYLFENTKNNLKTWFPGNPSKAGIKVSSPSGTIYAGKNLSMNWIDRNNVTIQSIDANYLFASANSNELIYSDIFENLDNQYIIDPDKVKHNYVLKEMPSIPGDVAYLSFSEEIEVPEGWFIQLNDSLRSLIVVDTIGNLQLQLPYPEVYEQNNKGIIADDTTAYFELVNVEPHKYVIQTIVKAEWLLERNYPVVVDPTIVLHGNNSGYIWRDQEEYYVPSRCGGGGTYSQVFNAYNSTDARIALNRSYSYNTESTWCARWWHSSWYGWGGHYHYEYKRQYYNDYYKGWIKYNTSSIPDGSIINAVEFSANINGGYTGSLYTNIYSSYQQGPYSTTRL